MTPLSTVAQGDEVQSTRNSGTGIHQHRSFCTDHSRFSNGIFTAVDENLGLGSSTVSRAVPFVDAPLFGPMDLDPQSFVSEVSPRALPPRAVAQQLADVYFDFIEPIEPVLNRARSFDDLETIYRGSCETSETEWDIRRSILNLVFALATQRQESLPPDMRQTQANEFFKRAWVLFRPEFVLWHSPGSIEMVQCLILLNRYLHCTSHQQKAWMTSGLAYRLAQVLCCEGPASPCDQPDSDVHLKRQVWASCVALDRYAILHMDMESTRCSRH